MTIMLDRYCICHCLTTVPYVQKKRYFSVSKSRYLLGGLWSGSRLGTEFEFNLKTVAMVKSNMVKSDDTKHAHFVSHALAYTWKHYSHNVLNKAYIYSHKHQVLQVHKQSRAQTLSVFFFGHSQHIKWAKHIISPNVGFFTFRVVLTVMYVSHLTEERRVWPLILSLPGLCWGLENKGQFTDEHSNMAFNEQ